MTTNERDALLHVLGNLDGALEPQPLADVAWQSDKQLEAAYTACGAVPCPNPGGDATGRKRFVRGCAALERAGLIFRHGGKIGLTVSGDATARGLAGLPAINDALDLLSAVATCPAKWDLGWVAETSLCGLRPLPPGILGEPRTPERLTSFLVPHANALIAHRLLRWRIVRHLDGVILYGCTQAGFDRAAEGDVARWARRISRPKPFPLPESYASAWLTAFSARATALPERANVVAHLDPTDPPEG